MDEKREGQIFVKPKNKKLIVRHPGMVTRILKPEGEWVRDSIEWQRLIRDKDVTVGHGKDEKDDESSAHKESAKGSQKLKPTTAKATEEAETPVVEMPPESASKEDKGDKS